LKQAVDRIETLDRAGLPAPRHTSAMVAFHTSLPRRVAQTAPLEVGDPQSGYDGFGASRAVPAAKAERRLWVPERPVAADD